MTTAVGARSSTAGDDTTTQFTATFRANSETEVGVALRDDTTGAVTVQTITTHYTVALDATTGQPTVTFVTAPASGNTVLIYPTNSTKQEVAPTPGGPLFGSTVEEALDRVVAQLQELDDLVGQTVRFPQAESAVSTLVGLLDGAGEYLYFNNTTGQPETKDLFDLSDLMASNPQNDDIIQRKSNVWVPRTLAQLWTDLDNLLPDALTFSADADTGISRPGDDEVQIDVGGAVGAKVGANGLTLPLQPSFLALLSADASNVTGNGTAYTIIPDTEVYDRNADYDNTTGVFTAPVTGLYDFSGAVSLLQAGAATEVLVELVTSNRTYRLHRSAGGAIDVSNELTVSWHLVGVDMDAADTASVRVTVTGEGADTTDIDGDAAPLTYFSGRLSA